ncbi:MULTISPECIES: Lrp/AsnC family transcriptional regulator [Pigmentiphaga]|uniref:Lrp/AsnC family transcriptional regulator n=2 Tax=Pigmentiphaga TaxID=152267 RepID=A0A4Q7N8F3_9BURK|nr:MULTISPECIES: Lrp/AsnC family transcriptional regulator [Pigmentiphaga]MBN9476255.1 Lrp/AsnC family transcriptional regulator [Burkholderiales bacterium]MPS29003.1 Lrp/AsnC family transcriptional regulator [Alcaligenaceae bacterium SAGV5]MPS52677.1 Lrp/AsnC family transcriptional regulator [Alcaligenaceae bacterium SAGV3]MPT56820.1 Lrp/AsnC family transcriptional regulator [Alcaligenaceae bacterium]ODS74096.1 MAG: transcriptional regulator [Bordetella sp. SCN 67-23]OJW87458.1 MAG: transcri
MDKKDSNILSILQEDATLSVNEIAERVSLSPTACWKRIQRLTQEGVIRKQVCLLDNRKLGVGVTVFVAVKTNHHDLQWLQKFAAGVRDMPEVVEFYRMSGEIDYLLKVVVPDIQGFDMVYKKLIQVVELFDVSSSFAMEELKYTTALPLDYA